MSAIRAADILAVIDENEALKSEVDRLRRESNKWFDVALTRLGTIQVMVGQISDLKNAQRKVG